MDHVINKNPHDHNQEPQAWIDHLTDCLYSAIYGSIGEDAGTDDPFSNPSFGKAERDAINTLLMVSASVFVQHKCGAHENLSRYVDGLKDMFDKMSEGSIDV